MSKNWVVPNSKDPSLLWALMAPTFLVKILKRLAYSTSLYFLLYSNRYWSKLLWVAKRVGRELVSEDNADLVILSLV